MGVYTSNGVIPVPLGVPEAISRSIFPSAGKSFYTDPVNGSNSATGLGANGAIADVATAYALTTDGANDTVYFLGGATATNPTATIAWANNYTHLRGVSSPLPGVGQRCRIVGTAANDLTSVMTVSGSGCIFENIQFLNGGDANADAGAVIVSGSRNAFINCFFAGMGHATPAARAGSYSLKVTGEENYFVNCTIGLDTIIRAAANPELWISTGADRTTFSHCKIQSYSNTAAKLAVLIDGLDRWVEFEDCIFENFSDNWGTPLTNAISDTVATTHYVILRGVNNQLVGITGWADTVTHLYGMGAAPSAGFGVSTQPTT